jgi:hypothetical protein
LRVNRFLNNESGATLVIVVITMFVLMGMCALAIDAAALITARRQMVRAADSAALAAAQSCATNQDGEASAKADEFATSNFQSATGSIVNVTPACNNTRGGLVTVRYEGTQDLYFAPILGPWASEYNVPARATAMWGISQTGSVLPLEFALSAGGAAFPCSVDGARRRVPITFVGNTCKFWFDPNRDHGQTDDSNWGFLNLNQPDGWPETAGAQNSPTRHCPRPGNNDIRNWLSGPGVEVDLVDEVTWVCVADGRGGASDSSQLFEALTALEYDKSGKIFMLPINDPDEMNNGGFNSGNTKYAIVGFAHVAIKKIWQGNDPLAYGTPAIEGGLRTCTAQPPKHDFTVAAPTFDLSPEIAMCEAEFGEMGGSLVVSVNGADEPQDYEFNEPILTWKDFAGQNGEKKNVQVKLEWNVPRQEGDPGACDFDRNGNGILEDWEDVDSDPNAFCIELQWVDNRIGGANPSLDAPGFPGAARSVRLVCEPNHPAECQQSDS